MPARNVFFSRLLNRERRRGRVPFRVSLGQKGRVFAGREFRRFSFANTHTHTHTSVAGKFTSRNLSLYLGPDPGVPPFFFSRHPYNPLPPFFLFFLRANERQKYILLHPR